MIGTRLAEICIKNGHQVVGCDNFFRGKRRHVEFLKGVGVGEQGSFEFHEIDLLQGLPTRLLLGVDVVIHLADVVGGVKYVFEHELEVFNLNVIIDANVVRSVVKSGVSNYIYAATACSFPHFHQNSISSVIYEQDKFPAEPESAYGWSKLVGELQAIYLNRLESVECARVIFHNVYGRWCDFDLNMAQVIPALINKVSRLSYGEPLEVWGDGNQVRSFINSQDIVESIIAMLESEKPLSCYDSIQLGDSVATSIDDLARIIIEESDRGSTVLTHNNPQLKGDIGRIPDLTLAQQMGLLPKISLREGIRDLINWAREHGHVQS